MKKEKYNKLLSEVQKKIYSDLQNGKKSNVLTFLNKFNINSIYAELYSKSMEILIDKEQLINVLIENIRQGYKLGTTIFNLFYVDRNILIEYLSPEVALIFNEPELEFNITSVNIAGCPIYLDEPYYQTASRINHFKFKDNFRIVNKIYDNLIQSKSIIDFKLNNGSININCKLKSISDDNNDENKRIYSIDVGSVLLRDNGNVPSMIYTSINLDIQIKNKELFQLEDLMPIPPKLNFNLEKSILAKRGIDINDIENNFELEEKYYPNSEQCYRIFKRYKDLRISFTTGWYQYKTKITYPYIYLSKVKN
jgi:hypothetical protein